MTDVLSRLTTALADRYRIARELGAGGMATVYLAHDLKHDRDVAIKVLHPDLGAALGGERFLSEIKTTAKLQHPHILPLLDSGEADGLLFYVMPYVTGETLRARLDRERQLPIDDALRIAREVADALGAAHALGIVHRDIKPENILVQSGHAVVADFGIALAVQSAGGPRMTQTGLSLGTPQYMSPEQAMGDKNVDHRADIYALGAVTYEMLTGEPPHTGNTPQAIVAKLLTEDVRPAQILRPATPAHVEAALRVALQKLPADRFAQVSEFQRALSGATGTTAVTSAHVAGPAASGGVSRRLFAGTVAAAILAVGALAALALKGRAAAPVSRFALALPDSAALGEAPSNALRIAIAPGGRAIAYVGRGATAGTTRLWLRRLEELNARPLAGTEGAVNPAFSPDGARIAFVTTDATRSLKTVELAGGAVTTLTDSLVDIAGLTWSADGYIYYDGKLEGDGLARVRQSGGSPEIATRPDTADDESWHMNPSALPGGRGVLYTAARSRSASEDVIDVLDTKTGKQKRLVAASTARYVTPGYLVYVKANGRAFAAPFDLSRLEITGPATPVLEGVATRGLQMSEVAVANDGSLVYVGGSSSVERSEFVWVGRDGKTVPVDTNFRADYVGPARISPDGNRVVTEFGNAGDGRAIWVKELRGAVATKIADAGWMPAWSPDGKQVVFVSNRTLRIAPADGSAPARTVQTFAAVPQDPEFTRDGGAVVFELENRLYQVAVDGAGLKRLSDVNAHFPAISPDGKWIAFATDTTGRWTVYLSPYPDAGRQVRQVSRGEGILPRWAPDGRTLYYIELNGGRLDAVSLRAGSALEIEAPQTLFTVTKKLHGLDVSPDGRFLLVRAVRPMDATRSELIIVQNFPAVIRAHAGTK